MKLEVEALVVEAFKVAKLAEVPKRVPIVAEVKLAMAAKRLDNTFKLVIEEVETIKLEMFAFVEVELVTVPLVEDRFVFEILVAEKLVEVELVIVPLATSREGRERLVSERLVIVALVKVALVDVRKEVEAFRIFPV